MAVLPIGINGEEGGYQIERSLRFNSADSAYLSRTPASAGNRRTWTWSAWVKRSALGSAQRIFVASDNNLIDDTIGFLAGDTLTFYLYNSSYQAQFVTTQVFRDPSSWYHIIVAVDTTQATSTNRVKIYVNGVQVTAFSTATYPTQNLDASGFNTTNPHNIGRYVASTQYFNGYMTEVHFIDGFAKTPSDFGEFNSNTGVWQPKAYEGSYGTNGFYLDFADNSSTTALGYDAAGSNDWTPNNFSVTAGAGNDSLVDTPTQYGTDTGVGGEVRGNYGVINPLALGSDATLSNGNLDISHGTSSTISTTTGTFGMSAGKWYWENTVTASSLSGATCYIGLVNQSNPTGAGSYPGVTSGGWSYYGNLGNIYNNNSAIQTSLGTYGTNDVIAIAFDADAGTIKFYKNNTQVGTTITGVPAGTYYAAWSDGSQGNTFTIATNFGQRPFAYTAPSGFKALCTTNLPEPTIADGGEYFDVSTWAGDSATPKAVVTDLAFQPDLIWAKARSATYDHMLFDSVRGAGSTKDLSSNTTGAEGTTGATYGYVSSIDTAGFTVTKGSGATNILNQSGQTFVGWQWKANGSGVSNTDGSITSTVSANTTSGFSIVTWTGNGASSATIGHGLGVAPSMIIVKNRSATWGWFVYNKYLTNPNTGRLQLNLTNGEIAGGTPGPWNNTAPTSTVFSLGDSSFPEVNGSGNSIVAYCFAEVPAFSSMGSYVGNGSTDGPFVYCGFRPRFVMIKYANSAGAWDIIDTARDTYNQTTAALYPNLSNAEDNGTGNGYANLDILSNGFKLRQITAGINASGGTFIYAAFAENPFKYALAR